MIESYPAALYASHILDDAVSRLEPRAAANPNDVRTLNTLGQIYRKQGRLAEAAVVYARLAALTPDDARVRALAAILRGDAPPEWPANEPLQPAPFALIRDFAPPAFHQTLLPTVLAAPEEAVVASTVGRDQYRPDLRQSFTVAGLQALQSAFWDVVAAALPAIVPRLQVPAFRVGGREVRIRTYRAGNFFEVHRDNSIPETADRQVSFVYFFHREPRRYTGGDLLLFDTSPDSKRPPVTNFTRIIPVDNAIVLFPSRFYHAVVPVQCSSPDPGDSRFVINGHIRRPATSADSARAV